MRYVRLPICCILASFLFFMLKSPGNVFASNGQKNDQGCIFMSESLVIPDDGSWLQICLVDLSAPDGSTVTETNVKVWVDHQDPNQLEIRFTRMDSKLVLSLSPDSITKEGRGELAAIHDFDGLPSQGEWILQIRDTIFGTMGSVKSATIAVTYAPISKMAQPLSENDGKPTSERVAAGALRISANPENDEKKESGEFSGMRLEAAGYSVPIMTQTFEEYFPPTGWNIYDGNPNDGKEYYWDDDNLKPYTGSWAAWPARGGADGIDPVSTTKYPANMDTWMIYGPFDLSNAKSADVAFMLWRYIENTYDHLFFGISSNGTNFDGWSWDGSADWENKIFSLNNYLGDSDVWIGWHFTSDGTIQYEGPWIDDIMLKFEPGDVTVQGRFSYYDRLSQKQGANAVKVRLLERDGGGDSLLDEVIIQNAGGDFSFPARMNWDMDDNDPNLSNRRLDLLVCFVLENANFKVTYLSGSPYIWCTATQDNVNMGTATFNSVLPVGWVNLEAMWFFQDLRRTREYYLGHTSPQIDPEFLTVHWEKDVEGENVAGSHFWAGPPEAHVFMAHSWRNSTDTMVHELGHHVMWNKTGQWLWYEFNCFDHDIFSQESVQCAWSEGWADFFAIAVNGDVCYDKGVGPCTGIADQQKYDLENHTRNDPTNDPITGLPWWGDGVEGRVAGTIRFDGLQQ